jgi:ribonuclease Z
MIIMPLGVGSATPTADRHLASVAMWREGRVFLFDCGENCQMRMLQAGMKRSKIDYIFITHLDGDHFFGLPGLITTMQLQRREKVLHIVAPEGIQKFLDATLEAVNLELCFEIVYHEIPIGTEHMVVVEEADFTVEVRKLEHSTYCVGYRFQEVGKPGKVNAELATEMGITEDQHFKDLKNGVDVTLEDGTVVKAADIVGQPITGNVFTYITDTRFCENAVKLAERATILYHESTFGQNLKDKAEETGHSTATEAAIVAKTANAERLVIGHFSARYTNPFVLLKEAKMVFEDTWIATELRPIMTDPEQERGIFQPAQAPRESFQRDQRGGFQQRRPYPNNRGGSGSGGFQQRRPYGDRPQRPYNNDRGFDRPQRPYNNDRGFDRPQRPYNNDRGFDRPQRPFNNDRGFDRPQPRPFNNDRGFDRPQRPYNNDRGFDRPQQPRPEGDRNYDRPQPRPVPRPAPRPFQGDRRDPQGPDNRPPRRDYRDAPQENRPITPRNPFDEFDRF